MTMNSGTQTRKRWDKQPYRRIDRVRYDEGSALLTVGFADGEQVQLDPMPLLPRGTDPEDVDWWRVAANEVEVIFPIGDGWFEVPWDVIRLRTDPEFDAHWTQMSREIARSTGAKL